MTIQEIKNQLSILSILAHYGLEVGKGSSMNCPFHADGKASMKIYPETNTAFCFAGSCEVKSVDVIDFIMRMDNSTKREAILKAKDLIGNPVSIPAQIPATPKPETLDAKAIYTASLETMKKHTAAKAYCEGRGLKYHDFLGIGYKSQRTADKWGRGCIILPLRDAAGKTVSLYGRAIKGSGHYYTANRKGLYPYYPDATTQTLILTESVIDTASIRRYEFNLELYAILALYGTNGLTAEHKTAITNLKDLREIILALDNDAAGIKATEAIAAELMGLKPGLTISFIELPQGSDVNEVASQSDDVEATFNDLFARRETIANAAPVVPERVPAATLDTSNKNNLVYQTTTATYEVKGGVRTAAKDLDSLKVTLAITSAEGRRSRQKLDLYEDKQIGRCARAVAEKLSLRADLIELDLDRLTELLEAHRETIRTQTKREEPTKISVGAADRKRCLQFLKAPNLLERINELIERAGITGEENNRLLLFVVASSFAMPNTLHALIQGASGSGKTRLLRVVSELIPEEVVKRYTRVTDGSFYNQGEHYFSHKLLCFEDIDGLKEEALLAVRELQSSEILITSTSFKDEHGNIRGAERIVRGPIASMSCTTKAELYEDNISRCFVVAVDESREQSLRIIDYQNKKSAGKIDGRDEQNVRQFMQNCLRMLEPLEVVNPFADKIKLPEDAHKIRRLNELYQSFVRQITLLNQYQRERDARGRVITAPDDLRVACEILFESIVLKVDELDGSLRQFFENVKKHVGKLGKDYAFNRFELRKITGVSKTQQHRYLSKLVELEYVRQNGFANRGYHYKIAHWDDQSALRGRIKTELNQQIEALSN
ncbi:toprim domain-containing protein [Neolewinella agarilytica]|uniref:CHC2 zinc finger n=1 Tax=Neolewinella agarilytica TaxID=478744 RepID=A0A1H9PEM6_9BACT|nr:toprim domain-containing protein [Neolewinella agarilytica]SER46622.1 CHC2 zinc finger [Neolewinella agarilytica]